MSDETPVSLRKKIKSQNSKNACQCLIHNSNLSNHVELKQITNEQLVTIQLAKTESLKINTASIRGIGICQIIPDIKRAEHLCHRNCYKIFTNKQKYLKKAPKRKSESAEQHFRPVKQRCTTTTTTTTQEGPIWSTECIFCQRQQKQFRGKKERLEKCETDDAKQSIQEAAYRRSDPYILGLTKNFCLISKEAHYHISCRRDYLRQDGRNPSRHQDTETDDKLRLNAHNDCFEYICEYVSTSLIDNFNVERMSMLREKYLNHMQTHYPKYHNTDYKTYKLKDKLISTFGQKLKFWPLNSGSELVYSSELASGQAVGVAFETLASQKRKVQDTAILLRSLVRDAFKNKKDVAWPPSPDYLNEPVSDIPEMLITFLNSLLRQKSVQLSDKCERLVDSIAQDICYAVSNGRWMLPKLISLGVSLRHITGSAQTITMMNRSGHCVSNDILLEQMTFFLNLKLHGVIKSQN